MRYYEHGGNVYGGGPVRLDFSVNTNPRGLPEPVKRALASDVGIYTRYPDPLCRELRAALAAYHGLEPENILCGNGAADMIFRLCAWKKAARVLVAAPGFHEYERAARLFGGEVREHKLAAENGFALTGAFAGDITEDIGLVFLCNPHNPTGRLISAEVLESILRRCQETGALLLMDECFIEFTAGKSLIPRLGEYPNLLILRAFTKLYAMAGLRLGYLLGQPEVLEEIAAYGPEWSVSGPAQAAGLAALSAEPEWTRQSCADAGRERAYMREALRGLGLEVFPSDANFMLVKSGLCLHETLRMRGILTRECGNFSGLGREYIRLALRSREENDCLLKEIKEVLHG